MAGKVRASKPAVLTAPETNLTLTITPDAPLQYRAQGDKSETEHTVSLSRSTVRADEIYDEDSAEPGAPKDTVLSTYFSGQSQHGTFELLVRCRREDFKTSFEVESVNIVTQPKNVEFMQTPAFTVTEDDSEDPNDPVIDPAD